MCMLYGREGVIIIRREKGVNDTNVEKTCIYIEFQKITPEYQ